MVHGVRPWSRSTEVVHEPGVHVLYTSGFGNGVFPYFAFSYIWIRIRLFLPNKNWLEARTRRPERMWTAGLRLTRRVTVGIREYNGSSFCLLGTFEPDVIFTERDAGFSPQLLSVLRDYSSCSARERTATLLVPSSQCHRLLAQRSVLRGNWICPVSAAFTQ